MQTFSIRLEWATRPGGGGQRERKFLDFLIDDGSLREQLKTTYITALGWLPEPDAERAVRQLLRKETPDFPDGRQSLFVCPECADLGCGAISVVIERVGNEIIWKDFGFENSYTPEVDYEGFESVGPFAFNATDYFQAISVGHTTNYNEQ